MILKTLDQTVLVGLGDGRVAGVAVVAGVLLAKVGDELRGTIDKKQTVCFLPVGNIRQLALCRARSAALITISRGGPVFQY